jgi:hypothetical protein
MSTGIGHCHSCKARILWLLTEASRTPIPLDPEPKVGGSVELVDGLARVLGPAARGEKPLYVPHHATCAQGKQWRRKEKRS